MRAILDQETDQRESTRLDVNWFRESEAQVYAEALARGIGLDGACRRRGLDGLLNVRPVRLCAGVLAVYIFGTTVGCQGQPRMPVRSDQYDLWHAIMASTADAFVTYDRNFAKLLRLVPLDGFSVYSSISTLLAKIS